MPYRRESIDTAVHAASPAPAARPLLGAWPAPLRGSVAGTWLVLEGRIRRGGTGLRAGW